MISDARFARRYLRSYVIDPAATKAMAAAGVLVKAPTIADLALGIGADAAALKATVERFNGFARTGIDQDFGRGNSAYDRYYSDPLVRPNPNLGPLERGPFTAVQLVPGDLGTKGGLRHRRERPGAARGRLRDRGAVLGRQQLGVGDGAHLPRTRLHARPGRRVRSSRRQAPRHRVGLSPRRLGHRLGDDCSHGPIASG